MDLDLKEIDNDKSGDAFCIVTDNVSLQWHLHWKRCANPEEESLQVCVAQCEHHEEQKKVFSYIGRNRREANAAPAVTAQVRGDSAPAMPVTIGQQGHREREPATGMPYDCAVARKVSRGEVERVPAARAAVGKEWDKLAKMPHSTKAQWGRQ